MRSPRRFPHPRPRRKRPRRTARRTRRAEPIPTTVSSQPPSARAAPLDSDSYPLTSSASASRNGIGRASFVAPVSPAAPASPAPGPPAGDGDGGGRISSTSPAPIPIQVVASPALGDVVLKGDAVVAAVEHDGHGAVVVAPFRAGVAERLGPHDQAVDSCQHCQRPEVSGPDGREGRKARPGRSLASLSPAKRRRTPIVVEGRGEEVAKTPPPLPSRPGPSPQENGRLVGHPGRPVIRPRMSWSSHH